MQYIEILEENHRKCLDFIDKIKVLKLRIEEDKAYLQSYDKTAWYLRPPVEYANAKSETVANREKTVKELEKKYQKSMAEITNSLQAHNNLIAIAESFHTNW